MKTVRFTKYQCEKCNEQYLTAEEALSCEEKPISQDKGVQIGDFVIITGGEGLRSLATVTSVGVCSKYWGHYAWQRYWHTVIITADIMGSPGSRSLPFDNYEKA